MTALPSPPLPSAYPSSPTISYTEYIQQCPLPRSTSCLLQSRSFELDTLFGLSGSQSCNGLEQHPKVFEYDCIRHVSGLLFGRNLPFGTSLHSTRISAIDSIEKYQTRCQSMHVSLLSYHCVTAILPHPLLEKPPALLHVAAPSSIKNPWSFLP